jgi:hypothetical protein
MLRAVGFDGEQVKQTRQWTHRRTSRWDSAISSTGVAESTVFIDQATEPRRGVDGSKPLAR